MARRAAKTRVELLELFLGNPTAESRELVAKFKKIHGVLPDFDLADVVDYGLMVLAGQVAKTPLIPEGQGDLYRALGVDPDRKVLRRTLTVSIQVEGRVVPKKLDVSNLVPEEFDALEIVDVQKRPKSNPTPLEVIRRDMERMRASGKSQMKYGAFLREGG